MRYLFYFSLFALLFVFNFSIAQERIANGDFEKGISSWAVEVHGTTHATFSIDSSKGMHGISSAHITIVDTDGVDWHLQFQQIIGHISMGKRYRISYQACASEPVTINTWIQQYHDSYSILYSKTYNLITDTQTFLDSIDVSTDDSNVKFTFVLGALNEGVELWFDAVSIIESSITSVGSNQMSNLPEYFNLMQNYPNPFNPSTIISFALPSKSFVSLTVFDALGREVSVLFSEELPAGTYVKKWNADGLGSGVYFCRLWTEKFVETKKLLLLR